MRTFAFIDASNLFYGGEKSLGWKIDYKKLLQYLKDKYDIERALYFGGIELHSFRHNYLEYETVPVNNVEEHLRETVKEKGENLDDAILILISKHLRRARFYQKLEKFGYELHLKPVKMYEQEDGSTKRKANCDVDMAFYLMKEKEDYDRVIILSGDGDFLPVLKYLKKNKKEIILLARGPRTAREIRQFAGGNFKDFEYLKYRIQLEKNET